MRTWTVDEEDERILLDGVPVLEIGDYCESAEDNLPLLRFIVDACNHWEEVQNYKNHPRQIMYRPRTAGST